MSYAIDNIPRIFQVIDRATGAVVYERTYQPGYKHGSVNWEALNLPPGNYRARISSLRWTTLSELNSTRPVSD